VIEYQPNSPFIPSSTLLQSKLILKSLTLNDKSNGNEMRIADDILNTITKKRPRSIYVIGIDGPTAAGKTMLADAIANKLMENGISFFVFRLDWLLKDRKLREKELPAIMASGTPLAYESHLHMDWPRLMAFLKSLEKFKKQPLASHAAFSLKNLYNRDDNGQCNLSIRGRFKKGMVVIIEGHYTHLPDLRKKTDINLLLLATPEELLLRKKKRAGAYRNSADVKNYFRYIDLASFSHYLQHHGGSIKNIFDNTDYKKPASGGHELLEQWLAEAGKHIPPAPQKKPLLSLLSSSSLVPAAYHSLTENLWSLLCQFDRMAGMELGIHPESRKQSFEKLLRITGKKLLPRKSEFSILCFRKMYSKSPSYDYAVRCKEISMIVSGDEDHLRATFIYPWGHSTFSCSRSLRDLSGKEYSPADFSERTQPLLSLNVPNRHFIPPEALSHRFSEIIFNGNASAASVLTHALGKKSLLIMRCDNLRDRRHASVLLQKAGYFTYLRGYFIYASSGGFSGGKEIINSMSLRLGERSATAITSKALQQREKISAASIILPEGPVSGSRFFFRDGAFCGDIGTLKTSALRTLIRKNHTEINRRLTEYLLENYAEKDILPGIRLAKWLNFFPSSFSDLYQAMRVSEGGGIIFCNIYDPDVYSTDMEAYLLTAADLSRPLGLQVSQNAIGSHISSGNDSASGYLHKSGLEDFTNSIRQTMVRLTAADPHFEPPLYVAGIDHASVEHDIPEGTTLKFLKKAATAGRITSVCLDTTQTYVHSKSNGIKASASLQLSWLQKSGFVPGTTDIELSLGGLHYEKKLNFPATNSDNASEYWSYIRALDSKNKRHAAFLSDILLAYDFNDDINTARAIFRKSLSQGAITAVLHGTTGISSERLHAAINSGFHKVNFAGELLKTLLAGLPAALKKITGTDPADAKYRLSKIEKDLHKLPKHQREKIIQKLIAHLQQRMRDCRTPSLLPDEISFFARRKMHFNNSDIENIISLVSRSNHRLTEVAGGQKMLGAGIFLASMIEVPYAEFSSGLAKKLIDLGIRHFHTDAGDGRFVTRKFSGIEKIRYLKKVSSDLRIHVHLMIENPDNRVLKNYTAAGADVIYLHPRAFSRKSELENCLRMIGESGASAGLVVEYPRPLLKDVSMKIISSLNITHFLVLCVPAGSGGQAFREEALERIAELKVIEKKTGAQFVIEADGGMNLSSLALCRNAGATHFSGWSVLIAKGTTKLPETIRRINRVIR
jgi:ribulose-phosphate 3-epimerase